MTVLRRFAAALAGLRASIRRREMRLHFVSAALVLLLGVLVCLERGAWALIVLASGLVLAAEVANTALEHLADTVTVRQHIGIRRAKDASAGAVLLAAGAALVVGLLVFLPPLLKGRLGSCLL